MFCWKCGKEIAEEARFCSYCGAEVKNTGAAKTYAGAEGKRDYRAFVAIGLIILLLLAAATILIGTLSNGEEAGTAAETPLPAEGSPTAAESPAPTETPAPTKSPEPTETPRPRFISPEQYARENGLDWPAENFTNWNNGTLSRGFLRLSINDVINYWDENDTHNMIASDVFDYADIYGDARADGKSDLEAHEIGLEETGIDRRILGKEEYTEFLYQSALEAGVSEYDAEELREQDNITWDTAWNVYKYARDTGSSHEKAVGSVEWKCYANVADSNYFNRYVVYLDQGMSSHTAHDKANEETAKIYEFLQYWYEIKREDIKA